MAERSEHLAELMQNDTTRIVLELTINMPRTKEWKGFNMVERIAQLDGILDVFLKPVYLEKYCKVMELCKEGDPHYHCFISYILPAYYTVVEEDEFVNNLIERAYFRMHRSAYHQLRRYPYNTYYRRFKAPAICVNVKNTLHIQWVNYMTKFLPDAPAESPKK